MSNWHNGQSILNNMIVLFEYNTDEWLCLDIIIIVSLSDAEIISLREALVATLPNQNALAKVFQGNHI